jgi:type II secretory pathway predicted ATPase ExeA
MYLKYFGLAEKPFELTPDPKFLFLTPGHREALAQLTYGVQEQKGFMLISGEVGTGKTTLLRTLVHRLDHQVDCAFVTNSTLPFDEILEYALADFGVPDPGGTRAQRLIALNRFLISQKREKRKTVLIIDEAQNLSVELLEQVRLLSNFETTSEKLVQIILAGQPELHAKLQSPALRQLKQRIALRCALTPMNEDEIQQYIVSHLRVAGARHQPFTPAAIRRIARYSGGVPRIVNILCDYCLLSAYANQIREVDADTAERAIGYLDDGDAPDGWRRRLRSARPALGRYGRRAVLACSAGAVAGAALAAGAVSPSVVHSAIDAVSATMGGPISGVVRWLTTWWGS